MIPPYRDTPEIKYPEYQVAYGSYKMELEKLVKFLLERGWELQGGVSVADLGNGQIWTQAMIKHDQ